MDLISVVVPVFNGEDFIEACINSILNQTYKKIEIIVVDDGSTDNSISIVKSISPEIKILTQNNKGQSSALNLGWQNSKGKYLSYLSSDDMLYKNCFEELEKVITDDIALTYCNFELIDTENNIIKEIDYGNFIKEKFLEELLCYPGPGVLFKKKDFMTLGGWDEDIHQIPDFHFWIKLLSIGDFKKCNSTLSKFRMHKKSGSFKRISRKRSDEILSIYSLISKYHKNINFFNIKSNSLFIAAKHHLKSYRFLTALIYIAIVFLLNPKIIFNRIKKFF